MTSYSTPEEERRGAEPSGEFGIQPGVGSVGRINSCGAHMLRLALFFLLISIVAGVLGFTGVSAAAGGIARILFIIFIIGFIVFLVLGLMGGETIF
jgi:uncharacterized membrane protein YtjA (UPF0391 family)